MKVIRRVINIQYLWNLQQLQVHKLMRTLFPPEFLTPVQFVSLRGTRKVGRERGLAGFKH